MLIFYYGIFSDNIIFEHNKAKMQAEKLEKTKSKRDKGRGRKKEILGRSFGPNSAAQDSDDEKFDNPTARKPEDKPL